MAADIASILPIKFIVDETSLSANMVGWSSKFYIISCRSSQLFPAGAAAKLVIVKFVAPLTDIKF